MAIVGITPLPLPSPPLTIANLRESLLNLLALVGEAWGDGNGVTDMHSTLVPIYSAASIRCDKPFFVAMMALQFEPLVLVFVLTRCLKLFVFSVSGVVCIRECGW